MCLVYLEGIKTCPCQTYPITLLFGNKFIWMEEYTGCLEVSSQQMDQGKDGDFAKAVRGIEIPESFALKNGAGART